MAEFGDSRLSGRFWIKVEERDCGYGTPCWYWTLRPDPKGYGRYSRAGHSNGNRLAHRVAYEALVGPIKYELDHLCRVPMCVNPAHLEDVTHAENVARGEAGRNMREKETCANGHPFDFRAGRQRACRRCRNEASRRYRARNHKPPEARPCDECGVAFTPRRRDDARLCSDRCKGRVSRRRRSEVAV